MAEFKPSYLPRIFVPTKCSACGVVPEKFEFEIDANIFNPYHTDELGAVSGACSACGALVMLVVAWPAQTPFPMTKED